MNLQEFTGTYGSNLTPCTILTAQKRNGGTWYCVEGSKNVNFTFDEITNGTDAEELNDDDFFTASQEIYTLEELEEAINS
jgi:hypothetical protein